MEFPSSSRTRDSVSESGGPLGAAFTGPDPFSRALLSAMLYLASYHATGFYFDIARNDAFFVLLLVLSAFVTIRFKSFPGALQQLSGRNLSCLPHPSCCWTT